MANSQNLRPWKPGQSGNFSGRKPGIPNTKTRYTRLLGLTQKVKNPFTDKMEDFSVIEQIDMQLFAKALRGDTKAMDMIYDRLEGKPVPISDTPVLPQIFRDNVPEQRDLPKKPLPKPQK
jgi:hypothetical protein